MKIVRQEGIKDCGICCLLSIIRFYGGDVSKEYLRKITNTNKDGVSAYNLIEAASLFGIDSYGVNGELNKLNLNDLPCIAHVNVNSNYQHFVVIYKIEKNKVTIMDPTVGKKVLNLSEFKLMSTNNFIILKPKKKLPTLRNKSVIKLSILKYISSYKSTILIISILTLNILILDILIAFNFKYIINYCINYLNSSNILYISILIIVINTFLAVLNFIYRKILYKIIFVYDEELTNITFKQLLLLPYFYYKNRTMGEVLSRFNDLNSIKSYLIKFISYFISDLISLIIFFIFIFKINVLLSLLVLFYFLFSTLLVIIRFKRKKYLFNKVKFNEDVIENYIVESISNVDTTKGCHLEKRFIDKFALKYKVLLNSNYKYLNYNDLNNNLLSFLEHLLVIIIYGAGGYLVISNDLKLEDMILFQTFFSYLLNIIRRLIDFVVGIPDFKICLNRVEELFTILHEDFTKSYYFLSYKLAGSIKFNNLFYKIDNRIILNNINLEINVSDKVLLFGNSGSGKSTLVKMLTRYVEVPFGMIKIDNIDINHYHLDNIRRYISYVSSSELIFNDSIYNNICLYKDVLEEEFLKVIKITRVDKIFGCDISNYKKIIEENGFLLSSGERQRIILARSLLRKSSIYIFDEAFGQIDIDLTNKILEDMFKYLNNKIVIVISHRNNSKKYFNRILKLVDGEIIEKGI